MGFTKRFIEEHQENEREEYHESMITSDESGITCTSCGENYLKEYVDKCWHCNENTCYDCSTDYVEHFVCLSCAETLYNMD